jgi:protease I
MVPLFRRAMSKKRILMLVAPRDFYEPEYFAPRKLFDDEGFEICVASGDKHAFGAQGTEIVTWPVADQDQADYAALFVAGGKGMIDFSEDAAAKKLLRKFLRAGKPVALVCHGPLLAAKAKAVAGKEVTGWPDIRKDMEKAGAKWTGMPIERDGLLFTAVGPDDAEDLAYALASAVKGDKMLARSEAARLLGTRDAFRKLAVIHRMAAAAEEDDEEEFLRQLLQHEEEFGIEPEEEAFPEQAEPQKEPPAGFPEEKPGEPRPPAQPVPAAAPPAVVPPKPGPSTVVRFAPPRTDGQWQEVPSAPPAGFPFPAEAFQNTESLTALFRDPASWEAVRAAAAHPLKKAALQAYLVPAIVLLIGKEWWKNQKYGRSDNLKGAPFGVFDKDLLKQHRGQNINETVLGRSAIAQINMEVADLIGFAVSKLNSGYDISAYLYRSLHNRMVMFAGKNQGYELHKQAACAYCRWKLNMPSRVPKLELVENYDMRGKGLGSGFSRRMIYKCPRCEDMIGNLGLQIEALTQSISDDQETLSFLKTKIELHPGDDRARSAAEEMRARIAASQDSLQNARRDIEARKRLARVPYQHIVCINPDCKGVRIPLTFIDWTDESWQAGPQGERRVRMIADVFGIRKPGHEAEADDAPAAAGGSGEPDVPEQPFGARKPPSWLQRGLSARATSAG